MYSLMNTEGTWKLIQRGFSCSFGARYSWTSFLWWGTVVVVRSESSIAGMEHVRCILSPSLMLPVHIPNEQMPTARMAQLCGKSNSKLSLAAQSHGGGVEEGGF